MGYQRSGWYEARAPKVRSVVRLVALMDRYTLNGRLGVYVTRGVCRPMLLRGP